MRSRRRAVNADVSVSNPVLDLNLHARCCGENELRVNRVRLWRRGAHNHEGHDVLCRSAALQMRRSVIGMVRRRVVLVGRQSVVVLRVVVIVVGVRVEQGRDARRREQRWDEQQRQGAVHTSQFMRGGREGQSSRKEVTPTEQSQLCSDDAPIRGHCCNGAIPTDRTHQCRNERLFPLSESAQR